MASERVNKERAASTTRRTEVSPATSETWSTEQPEVRRILNGESPAGDTPSSYREVPLHPIIIEPPKAPEQKRDWNRLPPKIRKAIAANKKRLRDKQSVLTLQKLLNMESLTGTFDRRTIELIDAFQKKNSISPVNDEPGVVDEDTMRAFFDKLREQEQYNPLIFLIIDYYFGDTYRMLKPDITSLGYDKELYSDGAFDVGENGKDIMISIGSSAFKYHQYLLHTIGHELEHGKQHKERLQKQKEKKPYLPHIGVDEFKAEAFNILSKGLPQKHLRDFMDDAKRALDEWRLIEWQKISPRDRMALEGLFAKVRNKILEVYGDYKKLGLADPYTGMKEQYEMLGPKGH